MDISLETIPNIYIKNYNIYIIKSQIYDLNTFIFNNDYTLCIYDSFIKKFTCNNKRNIIIKIYNCNDLLNIFCFTKLKLLKLKNCKKIKNILINSNIELLVLKNINYNINLNTNIKNIKYIRLNNSLINDLNLIKIKRLFLSNIKIEYDLKIENINQIHIYNCIFNKLLINNIDLININKSNIIFLDNSNNNQLIIFNSNIRNVLINKCKKIKIKYNIINLLYIYSKFIKEFNLYNNKLTTIYYNSLYTKTFIFNKINTIKKLILYGKIKYMRLLNSNIESIYINYHSPDFITNNEIIGNYKYINIIKFIKWYKISRKIRFTILNCYNLSLINSMYDYCLLDIINSPYIIYKLYNNNIFKDDIICILCNKYIHENNFITLYCKHSFHVQCLQLNKNINCLACDN